MNSEHLMNEEEKVKLTHTQYLATLNLVRLDAIDMFLSEIEPDHSGIDEGDLKAVRDLVNKMSFLARRRLSIQDHDEINDKELTDLEIAKRMLDSITKRAGIDDQTGDETEIIKEMAQKIDLLERELRITDELLESSNTVLHAIPECRLHGPSCVPHAIEWIQMVKDWSTLGRDRLGRGG